MFKSLTFCKGTVSVYGFFHQTTPPETLILFDEKFDFEIADFVVSGAIETAYRWWAVSMTPLNKRFFRTSSPKAPLWTFC
jgi:hypothetical protein